MLQISEICILSIDKGEENWAIEGEIIFDNDLTTAFEVTYLPEEDEFENPSMELELAEFDLVDYKSMILYAVEEFED